MYNFYEKKGVLIDFGLCHVDKNFIRKNRILENIPDPNHKEALRQ